MAKGFMDKRWRFPALLRKCRTGRHCRSIWAIHQRRAAALAGIGPPLPRSFRSAVAGVPHCFELAWPWSGGALPGIAGAAQGLQPALAADKKFRVGRPKFAASAACLFRAQFCIQGHRVARAVRFPASGVGRVLVFRTGPDFTD